MVKKIVVKEVPKVKTQIDDEPDNIPDIDGEEEDEDEEEEMEDTKDGKCERSVHISTPYISVAVTTNSKLDSLDNVLKKAEHVMDKYKNHHVVGDKSGDFR